MHISNLEVNSQPSSLRQICKATGRLKIDKIPSTRISQKNTPIVCCVTSLGSQRLPFRKVCDPFFTGYRRAVSQIETLSLIRPAYSFCSIPFTIFFPPSRPQRWNPVYSCRNYLDHARFRQFFNPVLTWSTFSSD